MKERLSLTPGTPRFTARRLENHEDKVNTEDHEIYRSGVGTLLYLTKHSRPDICNPVREYQEDGKIIIKFVKSEDNEADIFTKNTTNIIFQKHQEKLVWDKKEVSEEKCPTKESKYEATGRMLKSKSKQDRQTDIPTEI